MGRVVLFAALRCCKVERRTLFQASCASSVNVFRWLRAHVFCQLALWQRSRSFGCGGVAAAGLGGALCCKAVDRVVVVAALRCCSVGFRTLLEGNGSSSSFCYV